MATALFAAVATAVHVTVTVTDGTLVHDIIISRAEAPGRQGKISGAVRELSRIRKTVIAQVVCAFFQILLFSRVSSSVCENLTLRSTTTPWQRCLQDYRPVTPRDNVSLLYQHPWQGLLPYIHLSSLLVPCASWTMETKSWFTQATKILTDATLHLLTLCRTPPQSIWHCC